MIIYCVKSRKNTVNLIDILLSTYPISIINSHYFTCEFKSSEYLLTWRIKRNYDLLIFNKRALNHNLKMGVAIDDLITTKKTNSTKDLITKKP